LITVDINELKAKLCSYLGKVENGEEVVITDHGREVAVVMPISAERRAVRALMDSGMAKWAGGKPKGKTGLKVKGEPIAESVLEELR
jgi:prevent-host-death family protein